MARPVRIVAPADVEPDEIADALSKAHRHTHERNPHRPLRELVERARAAYDATLDAMFDRLVRYVSKEIVGKSIGSAKKLRKADPAQRQAEIRFTLLTPSQLEEVKRIVRDYHLAFTLGTYGPESIPPEEVRRLMDAGLVPDDLRTLFRPGEGPEVPSMRLTDLAYQYGRLAGEKAQRDVILGMSAEDFLDHLRNTRPELGETDTQAMAWARYNAGHHMRNAGDVMVDDCGTTILDADAEQRRKYVGVVQEEVERAIDQRAEWRKVASAIGHRTDDWSRDMGRLAATEVQWAQQEGTAATIAGQHGRGAMVAKQVRPDACGHCVRLYLTAGHGSPPRVFKLEELVANGTNVGRKARDWKPVVGATHPWCHCDLVHVPEGWAFDEEGDLVPEILLRRSQGAKYGLDALVKSESEVRPHMTHGDAVPEEGLTIRVADPLRRQIIEHVVSECPPEVFSKDVGVTLITTDHPRVQNPLDDHDFGYWTRNEIRLAQNIETERLPRVLRHELGHSLNVYLFHKLGGGADAVRAWHDKLYAVSKKEGFVSSYAMKEPIENAAEVTRMYLFERPRLMLDHPMQFAFAHRAYRGIWKR